MRAAVTLLQPCICRRARFFTSSQTRAAGRDWDDHSRYMPDKPSLQHMTARQATADQTPVRGFVGQLMSYSTVPRVSAQRGRELMVAAACALEVIRLRKAKPAAAFGRRVEPDQLKEARAHKACRG